MRSVPLAFTASPAVALACAVASFGAAAQGGIALQMPLCSFQETWKNEVVAEIGRDYGTTRESAGARYRVTIRPKGDSIPMNRVHAWLLHVEDLTGNPVDSASICVDGGMPEHGHGLPTRPRMTENLEKGDYLIEGMKFGMRGWWVMKFVVSASGSTDSVRFNLKLP